MLWRIAHGGLDEPELESPHERHRLYEDDFGPGGMAIALKFFDLSKDLDIKRMRRMAVEAELDTYTETVQRIERERAARVVQQAYEHVLELEDAWARGAISEHDSIGRGGTRANRNASLRVLLGQYREASS